MELNSNLELQPADYQVIKNKAAYDQYARIKDAPAICLPNRVIFTSDHHTKIDPAAHMSAVMKRIRHLPQDEQNRIVMRTKAIKVLLNKVSTLRQQAFGIKKPQHHTSLALGLLDERASELIEYFGRMLSIKEVHEIISKKWGYDISKEVLNSFKKVNSDAINEKVKLFQSDYSDIRLTHKKGRVEELVQIYNNRKQKYGVTMALRDEEQLMKLLKQIKDECEGTSMRIDHHISGQLAITVNYAVQEQVMNGMTINDIVIARVAARSHINPTFILSRLCNSFYAKHSGFMRPDKSLEEQEIVYPSTIVYNWDAIEKQHKMKGDTGVEDAVWEDVTPMEQTIGDNIKDQLMHKLGIKTNAADAAQARVNINTKE